ncbi:hypothetical protein ACS0TY_027234 [Phlomoides rotata]
MEDRWAEEAAFMLNCKRGKLLFTYLGVTVGAKKHDGRIWEPVINKFKSKLSLWKSKNLSIAGRITLVNAVLNSIPTYILSLYRALKNIIRILSSLQRKFLWGVRDEKSKINWVKWGSVCESKDRGGLGIKCISTFNLALLGKWHWRFLNDPEHLWHRILSSKYGSDILSGREGIGERVGKSSKYSRWVKDIFSIEEGVYGEWFRNNIEWRLGNGERINF